MTRPDEIRARLDAVRGEWPDEDYWRSQFFDEDAALLAHAPDYLRWLLDERERLIGAIRQHRRDYIDAIGPGSVTREQMLRKKRAAAKRLWDALPPEARP